MLSTRTHSCAADAALRRPARDHAADAGRTLALLALVVLSLGAPTAARAAVFDTVTGRLSLDATYVYGFDEHPTSSQAELLVLDWAGQWASPNLRFDIDPVGLEGRGAFLLGGEALLATLDLSRLSGQFSGRRVEMRFWAQARGTACRATLNYYVGNWQQSFTNDWSAAVPLSTRLAFGPTGRATDDGWIELTSGPIDFALGGSLAPIVIFEDKQYDGMYEDASLGYDPDARVALDAFEISDLGPAAVAPLSCTLGDESGRCGGLGRCMLGRCVDHAALSGPLPSPTVRAEYIARRAYEISAFEGIRAAPIAQGTFQAAMEAALTLPEREFWPAVHDAYELLVDGHSYPPTAAYPYPPESGLCVYTGEADLQPTTALAPMVFTADPLLTVSGSLQPGDVLVAIDGIDPELWRDLASRFYYFGGDPAARAFNETPTLVSSAMLVGATLRFARCAKASPCSAAELETLELPLDELVGDPLWLGQVPERWYQAALCDSRFSHPIDDTAVANYEFAGFVDQGAVRIIEFNGFPDPSGSGSAWMNTMELALGNRTGPVLLDERRGDGGYPDSLIALSDLLLGSDSSATAEVFPPVANGLSPALLDAFRACWDPNGCGGMYSWTVPSGWTQGAQTARVALLLGVDVSANDFFTRYMQFRSAPTRSFGSAPIWGAYGVSQRLPRWLDEVIGGGYQGSDSVFWSDDPPTVDWLDFESGTGVVPDVLVHQKQSDARTGRDTLLEAARAWLLQSTP